MLRRTERLWFWATLSLSSISVVALVFAAWEVVENHFFRHADYITLHYLYITRGIISSLLLAFWAGWYVLRQRRLSEEQLRRSQEHYRGLLEASPGAVVLYDAALRVTEWNAAAERLYGFAKGDILGRILPTVPPEKEEELQRLLEKVRAGEPALEIETLRRDSRGALIDVQVSLLPFREAPAGQFFLEVTEDIRERVRMRQTLLEVEKLTSMGKMAAGTAHHLNTPLAAMLLRVQMLREQAGVGPYASDLERLEAGILFCKQFVQRLLDFTRRPPLRKQPEDVCRTIRSVLSFLAPTVLSKHASVSLNVDGADKELVLADRGELEVLFSTLLSNSLDAIGAGGEISISCRRLSSGSVEIRIADKGCGIDPADLPRIFEPFFTTKGPGKGTGLGLAIARNIVVEHGGSIRLESRPGEGTTAFISLPLCRVAAASA